MTTAAAAGAGSHRPWSPPGPWPSRRCRESVQAGRLCHWFLSPTPRLLLHPSPGGRHTPRPGSALCLSHNFRRIRGNVLSVSTLRWVCRFDLWVHHRAPSPPPSPVHLRPPLALPVHLDQDQRRARASYAPWEDPAGLLKQRFRQKTFQMTSGHPGKARPLVSKSICCQCVHRSDNGVERKLGCSERTPRRRRRRRRGSCAGVGDDAKSCEKGK